MFPVRIDNQSLYRPPPPPPYPQPIVANCYPSNTITRPHMFLETSCLTATSFIPSLDFSHTINEESKFVFAKENVKNYKEIVKNYIKMKNVNSNRKVVKRLYSSKVQHFF